MLYPVIQVPLVCPQCGARLPADAAGCLTCGAPLTSIATSVMPLDTTGLPPGATFGPSADTPTTYDGSDAITEGPDGEPVPRGDPLYIGQSIGNRYRIIRLLGIGGMGAVYQAWDAELGIAVALKVIRVDRRHASADYEKRFKNELLLARRVTHKNVVRIHDIGQIDGLKYITMSYIEGRDLASILRK